MFDRLDELLRNQPDWLEVPIPQGSLQVFESSLAKLGTTKEQILLAFIDRIIAAANMDLHRLTVCEIANSIISGLIAKSHIEAYGPNHENQPYDCVSHQLKCDIKDTTTVTMEK